MSNLPRSSAISNEVSSINPMRLWVRADWNGSSRHRQRTHWLHPVAAYPLRFSVPPVHRTSGQRLACHDQAKSASHALGTGAIPRPTDAHVHFQVPLPLFCNSPRYCNSSLLCSKLSGSKQFDLYPRLPLTSEMKPLWLCCLLSLLCVPVRTNAADLDELMPVRGLCIAAPRPDNVDNFVAFIDRELAPRHINTLILRVDYNYQFETHPELRDADALSRADVKKLVGVCRKDGIKIIPQINLLGHQSFGSHLGKLLSVYPEFDETPWVKMPEKYKWPNADKLYCKSYCPLQPKVHEVIFPVIDELCDVFETDAFHAGMDEIFYLGEDQCPRCGGRDKAELFADEVRRIHDHLREKNRRLWIWGDRLIDGKTTGLGEWEASYRTTARAIDLIPKDVMICDWHYERPDPTAVYFAMKGFDVVTCPWRSAGVATQQTDDMLRWRRTSSKVMRAHFQGMVQTEWMSAETFLDEESAGKGNPTNAWNCLQAVVKEVGKAAAAPQNDQTMGEGE